MKRLLLILLSSSCVALAQEDDSFQALEKVNYNAFQEHVPFWRMERNLKLSPFDIVSAIPTLGADLEVFMKRELSFQFGAAYVPSFMQFMVGSNENQFDWMHGYRLRFENRYFGLRRENVYVSAEVSLRHLIISDEVRYGMEGDEWGNFAYFLNESTTFHRFSTQFNFKIGVQKKLGKKGIIDLYTGLSLRRNNVLSNVGQAPEGGVLLNDWNLFEWTLQNKHKFGYALPILGFRMGWHWPCKKGM